MFLDNESVLRVLQAREVDEIPVGATGYHLGSQRTCSERSHLKRADRRGEILVCRNQLTIELRAVPVTLRRGPAGSGVFVLWCSVELVLADPAAIAVGIGPDHSPLPVRKAEERLRSSFAISSETWVKNTISQQRLAKPRYMTVSSLRSSVPVNQKAKPILRVY